MGGSVGLDCSARVKVYASGGRQHHCNDMFDELTLSWVGWDGSDGFVTPASAEGRGQGRIFIVVGGRRSLWRFLLWAGTHDPDWHLARPVGEEGAYRSCARTSMISAVTRNLRRASSSALGPF